MQDEIGVRDVVLMQSSNTRDLEVVVVRSRQEDTLRIAQLVTYPCTGCSRLADSSTVDGTDIQLPPTLRQVRMKAAQALRVKGSTHWDQLVVRTAQTRLLKSVNLKFDASVETWVTWGSLASLP